PHCCQSFPCGPYPWLMSLLVVVVDAAAPPNRLSVPGRNSGNHLVAVQRLSLSAAAARAGRRRSPPAPTARTAAAGEARRRPSPHRGGRGDGHPGAAVGAQRPVMTLLVELRGRPRPHREPQAALGAQLQTGPGARG